MQIRSANKDRLKSLCGHFVALLEGLDHITESLMESKFLKSASCSEIEDMWEVVARRDLISELVIKTYFLRLQILKD